MNVAKDCFRYLPVMRRLSHLKCGLELGPRPTVGKPVFSTEN